MLDSGERVSGYPDSSDVPIAMRQPIYERFGFVEGFARTHPNHLPLSDLEFVVVDAETSGLEKSDRIVELAAIRTNAGGEILGSFETLIRPSGVRMSPGASDVNGIFTKDLNRAPIFAEVWPELKPLLFGAVLVAHNAPFDIAMLNREFDEWHGPRFPVLDTLWLARNVLESNYYSLDFLSDALSLQGLGEDHTALSDVVKTAELLRTLIGGPIPLFWHGVLPPQATVSRESASRIGRLADQLPQFVPEHSIQVGRQIEQPKEVVWKDVKVPGISGKRFYPVGDSAEVQGALRVLLDLGGVQAKRLTPSAQVIVASTTPNRWKGPIDVPVLAPRDVEVLASNGIQMAKREAREINHWLAGRHEKRVSRVPHWRPVELTTAAHMESFPFVRWTMNEPERQLLPAEEAEVLEMFQNSRIRSIWVLDEDRSHIQIWIDLALRPEEISEKLKAKLTQAMNMIVTDYFWEPARVTLIIGNLPVVASRARQIK